jgi:hypothetical protein
MKEYMFFVRNEKDAKKTLTPEQHHTFIKKCEDYINHLRAQKKLIAAQPLIREGIVIQKTNNVWSEKNIPVYSEVHVGYYHILANDFDEAVRIAKENPEFEFVPSASIEVRPIKIKETGTGFIYPTKNLII